MSPNADDNGVYSCCVINPLIKEEIKVQKAVNIADHFTPDRRKKLIRPPATEAAPTAAEEDAKLVDGKEKKPKEKIKEKPKITVLKPLKTLSLEENMTAEFKCAIEGTPREIKWHKDGQLLPANSAKYRTTADNGYISLEILNTTRDDSGNYTCTIRGPDDEEDINISSNLLIHLQTNEQNIPKPFAGPLKETFNPKRNELTIETIVRGRPKIEWTRDGSALVNNRYRQREEPGGICRLIITNPVASDFGSFCCRTEDENCVGQLGIKLDYEAYKKQADSMESRSMNNESCHGSLRMKPTFSTPLRDRSVADSSSIKLTCNILGNDFGVKWLKDDQPLSMSSRYRTILDNGLASLEIFSTCEKDSGEYSCVARNDFGDSISRSLLKVYRGFEAIPQAPVFTRTLRDTYYLNENELVLDCRVRGHPKPDITWLKDTDLIMNDDKYQQLDQADGFCKLIIRNPTETDSGVYTCRAENSVNAEKMTHTVDFAGRESFILEKAHGFFHRDPNKPHLANTLGDHIVTAGGTIAIQAEFAKTTTPIEVQWFKDKSALTAAPNVRTFADHGVYTLAIEKATEDYSGTYTCRASNAFGRIESNANVHVISPTVKGGKPALFLSRPETEMKIAIHDPFSISFRVQGEPKPKLILMKGTKDITKSDRVTKEQQEDYMRFTVHNSTISDSGTYFVVARNEHGTDRLFVTIAVKNPKK